MNSFSTKDDGSTEYGERNPNTGELVNKVPKYFISEVPNFSEDLIKNIQLYARQVISYEGKKEMDEFVRLTEFVESQKNTMVLQGDVLVETSVPNTVNAKIFSDFVKHLFFGQKYIDTEGMSVNANVGKTVNSTIKAINKKLNIKIPLVSEEKSNISLVKLLDNFNHYFTIKVLGGKLSTALVNFLGTTAQAQIGAGKYYTKSQHIRQETTGWNEKFKDAETELALMKLINPFGRGELQRELDKLSVKTLNKQALSDLLMILMRKPEEYLRYVNMKCFLQNTIVIDDKLVNARVYYKSLPFYKNAYKEGRIQEVERNMESEVQKLIQEYGLEKNISLKDGKAVIKATQESIDDYITLIKTVGASYAGSIPEGSSMMVKMNVYSNSFMVFKTWIPSLMDQRFGAFKYNSATDAYEYGRVRSAMRILVEDFAHAYTNFSNIYKGNKEGIAYLDKMWEKRKAAYLLETGLELSDNDKEQYYDLIRTNLKNLMTEMLMILSIIGLILGASMLPPDDEAESNEFKFLARTLDRLKGELMFFYNPNDFEHFVNGNLIPALGLLQDITTLLTSFTKEFFGLVLQNEEMRESAEPVKSLMKIFPITNASLEYLPIFLPDWSKEAGIVIKKEITQ